MRVRSKLFVVVGALFVLIMVLSYFMRSYAVKRDNLRLDQELIQESLAKQDRAIQQNRDLVEKKLIQLKSDIDSMLYLIDTSSYISAKAFLDPLEQLKNWQQSARLMVYNEQLGFLQQTSGGKVMTCIAVDATPFYNLTAEEITHNISWVAFPSDIQKSKGLDPSYAAVRFKLLNPGQKDTEPYYLFRWDVLLTFSPAHMAALEKREDLMAPFADLAPEMQDLRKKQIQSVLQELEKAQALLQKALAAAHNNDPEELKKWLREVEVHHKTFQEGSVAHDLHKKTQNDAYASPYDMLLQELKEGDKGYNKINLDLSLAEMTPHQEATFAVRQLAILMMSSLGLSSPFDPNAPIGAGYLDSKSTKGLSILTSDIYFDRLLFNDREYFEKNPPKGTLPVASSLTLIRQPTNRDLILGNTLKLPSDSASQGPNFFTLGFRLFPIIQGLSQSANIFTFLSKGGEIVSGIANTGDELPEDYWKDFPLEQMKADGKGKVDVSGVEYYYATVLNLPKEDIYLFFFVPSVTPFVKGVDRTIESIFLAISHQLMVITLICFGVAVVLLILISGRITRPIALLAKATEKVAKGQYTDITLPKTSKSSKDEISILSHSFSDMIDGLRDREKIHGVLNKVVSKEIADEILKGNVHLGGEEKVVTVFFADIRNFTKMTELMPPHEVIQFLNAYMTKMSDIIDKEGGVIDKYIGDGIMALYGAPLPHPNHALRAIGSGIKMRQFLEEWNQKRMQEKKPPITIGMGIHTGPVVAGNMGAETRLNYTVIGATVNLASRLCSAAKPMEILISEETLNAPGVREQILFEKIDPLTIRGFSTPINVYVVKGFRFEK